jgi:Periplasmic binding protein domain
MNPQFGAAPRGERRGRARPLAALVVAGAIAAALTACGSSSSSSSTNSTTSASNAAATSSAAGGSSGVATAQAKLQQYEAIPTKIVQTQSLTSPPPTGKTLVMLGTADPGNVLIQKNLADLAKLAHWNYSQVSYDPANIGTFNSAIQAALAKHPNYVAEAGLPLTAQQINAVQSAGAKWMITAVYPVTVKPPIIAASNAYENDAEMGRVLAYYFVADSGGKGNAVIEHVPAYPILTAFTNAFTATVKSLCPACKTQFVNITLPDVAAGKISSDVVSALRSNPSANYLVFDYGPFADGINSALDAAGLSGKVKIIGQAADAAAIAGLKSGQQAAWTGFDPAYQSLAMFDSMFRDLEGLPINEAQEGLQPTQILTKANINSVNIKNGFWSEPADALQQFKTLWKMQ